MLEGHARVAVIAVPVRLHRVVTLDSLFSLARRGVARLVWILDRIGRGHDHRVHTRSRVHQRTLPVDVSVDLIEQPLREAGHYRRDRAART